MRWEERCLKSQASQNKGRHLKSDMKKIKEKNYMDNAFLVFANERLKTFEKG